MIRTADRADLDWMLDWAAAEGWNPGREDPAAFWAADPGGFFISEVDGQPAACISVVNHSADFAFLGLYICHPDFRGHGFGIALWTHALAHAEGRTVGLDGVADQQDNYARSGFLRQGGTSRFEGQWPKAEPHPTLRLAHPADIPALLQMDAQATGISRPSFMTAWLRQTETRRTIVSVENRHINGFATARLCRAGVKIGPVIAERRDIAVQLISNAAAELGQNQVVIDVPGSQNWLADHLLRRDFSTTFSTARMYLGAPPKPNGWEHAAATLELG